MHYVPDGGFPYRKEDLMVRNRFVVALAAVVAALNIACAETDPGITTAVKAKFAADDVVKAYKIDVDTKDHVVTLTGAIDSSAAKVRAVELARATDGVNNVIDNLTVAPGATPTTGIDDPLQKKAGDAAARTGEVTGDAAITAAVKTKFLADTTVSGLKIDVDTTDGVVTLTGNVSGAAEKARAMELARDTTGVKSVTDRLKIAR
jgi:hyperosmotically inducible periplasmic protein